MNTKLIKTLRDRLENYCDRHNKGKSVYIRRHSVQVNYIDVLDSLNHETQTKGFDKFKVKPAREKNIKVGRIEITKPHLYSRCHVLEQCLKAIEEADKFLKS